MIVDLRSVLEGPRHFNLTIEEDWWEGEKEDDQIQGLDGPLDVSLSISRAGVRYLLDGHLSGRLCLRCDRCLEPYLHDLRSDFRLFFAQGPASGNGPNEVELLEQDLSTDFVTEERVDLDGVIREQIYLSLPIKSLCREDCSGLCPVCGIDLNNEKCQCRAEERSPYFSKLKDLKLKGE